MVRVSSRAARLLLALALLVGPIVALSAAPVAEGTAPKAAETPAEKIRKDLDKLVSIEITDQPLTLAMNQLRDQTKVNIVVDRLTLNQMGIDPESMPVSINLKDVKLRSALRSILTSHNLSFAIVSDTVIVSTDDVCMHRQMRQRVSVDSEKGDLASTLRKLARETGTNLIIDPKVTKEASAPVTMQLDDVPLDTAVRLMTEMAGLKVVRVGNVMFVCSKTTAAEMRQDPDLMGPGGPGVPGVNDVPVPVPLPPGRGGIQILPGNLVPPGVVPAVPQLPAVPQPEEKKQQPDRPADPQPKDKN
jgi:hypothetical protein